MNGKVLKISSNDLYGNVDDRQVVVFACFIHTKYMNRYAIFTFKDEYDKNKLYFGSVHVKDNSLVIFNVYNSTINYIEEFVNSYLNSSVNKEEYEIIDISKIEKVELVSYNSMDCDKLLHLDNISIEKEKKVEDTISTNKKPVFLYLILIVLILLLVGITYLYINPEAFTIEYKMISCTISQYNNELDMSYDKNTTVKFNKKVKVSNIEIVDNYTFLSQDTYEDFKNNQKQNEYFNIDGTYKYDDNNLELKIIYNDKSIIENYDEMLAYLKKEGHDCVEGKYYE